MPEPAARALPLREALLGLGFVILLVTAVVTVARPELTKEPEREGEAASPGADAGTQAGAEPVPAP